ncbi:hypothetical protein D3C79_969830 [compost metagenome]
MLASNAANLQVAAVGDFYFTPRIALGRSGNGIGLISRQRTACQLDPADAAVQRLDDAPQPRTGRGTQRSLGLVGRYRLVQKVTRQS